MCVCVFFFPAVQGNRGSRGEDGSDGLLGLLVSLRINVAERGKWLVYSSRLVLLLFIFLGITRDQGRERRNWRDGDHCEFTAALHLVLLLPFLSAYHSYLLIILICLSFLSAAFC